MSGTSELVQMLFIFAFLLGFLAFLVVVVIINPNKVKIDAKKESSEASEELSVSLDSTEKQKS